METETPYRLAYMLLVTILFVVRAYYHLMAHRRGGAYAQHESRRHALGRWLYVVAGAGVLLLYILAPQTIAWAAVPLPTWLRWVGAGLATLSIALLVWVHHTLAENFSATLHIREQHTLITNGPYRFVRHPMYTIFYILILASFLLSANWFVALFWGGGVTLLLLTRLPKEEALMLEIFGEQYHTYMQHTGRFLPWRLS